MDAIRNCTYKNHKIMLFSALMKILDCVHRRRSIILYTRIQVASSPWKLWNSSLHIQLIRTKEILEFNDENALYSYLR